MKYNILELNTNVKPTFMMHLLRTFDLEKLVYLDADIFVYSPLAPVFDALEMSDAVLTAHITHLLEDDKLLSEQDHLYNNNGTFNSGFIAVRRGDETDRILSLVGAAVPRKRLQRRPHRAFRRSEVDESCTALFARVCRGRHHTGRDFAPCTSNGCIQEISVEMGMAHMDGVLAAGAGPARLVLPSAAGGIG